jgi:hypothetical protein
MDYVNSIDNVMDLMNVFQNRFTGEVDQANFKYLEDLWPASSEAYFMDTVYNDGVYGLQVEGTHDGQYYGDENGDGTIDSYEAGKYTYQNQKQNTWKLNEYGRPVSEGDAGYNPADFSYDRTVTQTVGRYNNRQYGHRDGTYQIASVNTGGTRYVIQENYYTSPLLFDMDGDGVTEASDGKWMPHPYANSKLVEFDIDGDGFIDLSEWVGPNDGLLIVYDGQKDVSANDLFGNAGGFATGYEKLSLLDANSDKKIDGDELATLSIWQDKNGNAKVDTGEVSKVQDLGITMISLAYDRTILVSHFVQNGEKKRVVDWYPSMFVVKKTR